jgi:hypothetical protein
MFERFLKCPAAPSLKKMDFSHLSFYLKRKLPQVNDLLDFREMVLHEVDDETLSTIYKYRIVVHVIADDHYVLMDFAALDVSGEKRSLLVIPMSYCYFSLPNERVVFGKIHLNNDE